MVLVDRPIEGMLSAIAICMWHTGSISVVVALIFMASSFLIRFVSLGSCTIQNQICFSFTTSVGKLHLLANPQIHSVSLSGVWHSYSSLVPLQLQ